MKSARSVITLILGFALGALVGSFIAREQARVAVLSGPSSDNYGPARSEIAQAVTKLRAGDTNVIDHLTAADAQIRQAQQWSERFLGQEHAPER